MFFITLIQRRKFPFSSLLRLLGVFLIFTTSACLGKENADADIYTILIDSASQGSPPNLPSGHFVIVDTTGVFISAAQRIRTSYKYRLTTMSKETFCAFQEMQKSSQVIQLTEQLRRQHELIKAKEFDAERVMDPTTSLSNLDKEIWERFHSKHPGAIGYLELGNIGYNKKHNQALVVIKVTFRAPFHYDNHGYATICLLGRSQGQKWNITCYLPIRLSCIHTR